MSTHLKTIPLLLLPLLLTAVNAYASEAKSEPGFVPLFDGKTLQGWEGDFNIWSAQNGLLIGKIKDDGFAENKFLCTEKRYQNFELRLEFRVVNGDGNTGVQFRAERLPNSSQVSGYQADIGTVFWGSLYDEARRDHILNCPDPEGVKALLKRMDVQMRIEDASPTPNLDAFKESIDPDGWNDYVIHAEGDQITLIMNGHTTATYKEKVADYIKPGIIGLQMHSGGRIEVQFRNLRIKELNAKN